MTPICHAKIFRSGSLCKTDGLKVSHLWQGSWRALQWDPDTPPHSPEPRRSFLPVLLAELQPKRQFYVCVWWREIWTCHLTWRSRQISPNRLAVPPETGRAAGPFRFCCSLPWLRRSCGVFRNKSLVSNSLWAQTEATQRVLIATPGTTKEYTETRQFPCQKNSSCRKNYAKYMLQRCLPLGYNRCRQEMFLYKIKYVWINLIWSDTTPILNSETTLSYTQQDLKCYD